jgi:hypothetical protein
MHVQSPDITEAAVARIVQRLSIVRRGIASRCWVDGAMRVAWLILALAAADLAVDWLFRLDRAQRMVLLGGATAVIVWCATRWLVKPLRTPTSDDALVLQLEQTHPRLQQALITSLQLARMDERRRQGMSPELVMRAIATGAKAAEEISAGSILDQRRLAWNAALLVAAAALLSGAVLALPFTATLRIWFRRNVLLTSATWPQNSYLMIERVGSDATLAFPLGQSWKLAVTVSPDSKLVPEVVYVEVRKLRQRSGSRSLAMQRADEARFESAFDNVTEPFELRARGGDAVTEWISAVPVEPPGVRELSIVIAPPGYAGLPKEKLMPGESTYPILHGSSLAIAGIADKKLARAELVHGNRRWQLLRQEGILLEGMIPANEVDAGKYVVELIDMQGFHAAAAEFALSWRPDHPPEVAMKVTGVGGMVLPQAHLPFSCRVTDDFGLTAAKIVLRTKGEGSETREARHELPLTGPSDPVGSNGNAGQHEWLIEDALDLASRNLSPDTNLTVHAEALDNNNVQGPNIGRSTELTFRVVSEGEFRSELLRKEKRERVELEALVKLQERVQTEIRVLAAAGQPESEASDQPALTKAWREQKALGQKLAALAGRLDVLATEVQSNRLSDEGGRLKYRLANEIAAPIRQTADEGIAAVVEKMDRARQVAKAGRGTILAEVVEEQNQVVARLKQVLDKMTSHQGFQEAIDLLYEIQKAQGEVHDQTNQAREERIRRILEGK